MLSWELSDLKPEQKIVNADDRTMKAESPFEHTSPGVWVRGLRELMAQDDLNFWLTNRIPRVLLTRFMGWYSRLESGFLTRINIAVWRIFSDLDLSESPPAQYRSLQSVFTRPLRTGQRPIDARPTAWCSPVDAIVGASGRVVSGQLLQIKGAPYSLGELIGNPLMASGLECYGYTTLRLTSAMYHRLHGPVDMRIVRVDYISGDVFNVNPPALRRISGLFCRNERAVIHCVSQTGQLFFIVAVAAVLVASIRLHCLSQHLNLSLPGHCTFDCDYPVSKGEEFGWFEQGSTVILLTPECVLPTARRVDGNRVQLGQCLFESSV